MLRDYLKVRKCISGMTNILQLTTCNQLIRNFKSKWKNEGHEKTHQLKGYLSGVVTERF